MVLTESSIQRKEDAIRRLEAIDFYHPERSLEEANALIPEVESTIDDVIKAWEPWMKERRPFHETRDALYDAIMKTGMISEYYQASLDGRAATQNSAYTGKHPVNGEDIPIGPRTDLGDYAGLVLIKDFHKRFSRI